MARAQNFFRILFRWLHRYDDIIENTTPILFYKTINRDTAWKKNETWHIPYQNIFKTFFMFDLFFFHLFFFFNFLFVLFSLLSKLSFIDQTFGRSSPQWKILMSNHIYNEALSYFQISRLVLIKYDVTYHLLQCFWHLINLRLSEWINRIPKTDIKHK